MTDIAQDKQTILVVDDQGDARMLVANLLDNNGYQHEEAGNGQEALGKLQSGLRPDLILLDIIMPEMDGYGFLDAISLDSEIKEIPVVMLTALGQPGDVVKALKLGAADYCTKPIEPNDMLGTIKRVLQRRH